MNQWFLYIGNQTTYKYVVLIHIEDRTKYIFTGKHSLVVL